MDFLTDRIKPIYFKYLSASFGTAMIASIYSIVDVAMVGQYQGPEGTAALAVVAPAWNTIYSLGLLMGAGGSVLFSIRRGGETGDGSENQYFSAALIGAVVLAVPAWVGIIFFDRPILTFFGADSSLLVLAQAYMRPVKYVFPLYLFNQVVAAFLRNDKSPGLATLGVLCGGIFNIFGDYFFVFTCFLFRPRKSCEKHRKCSHTNVSNASVIRFSTPPAQTATFAFTSESGYTTWLSEKDRTQGLTRRNTGCFGWGWYHYPRSVPRVLKTLRGRGLERQTLPLLGLGRGCSQRTQRAFGTAMRLCASLSRGVAAPLGCVICLQLGDVAVFSLCAQYFLNVRGGGGITTPGVLCVLPKRRTSACQSG